MSGILARPGSGQDRYERATAQLDPPFAVVDLPALDSNARDLLRRAGGLPIRVASKSLRSPAQAALFAKTILSRPGFVLVGVMGYEGQIAGLGDAPPGHPVRAAVVRMIQARSAAELRERRVETVRRIRAGAQASAVLPSARAGRPRDGHRGRNSHPGPFGKVSAYTKTI